MHPVRVEAATEGLLQDGRSLMDNIAASVRGGAGFANHVQYTLDEISYNTGRKLFWWTSTFITMCLGLFLLAQLVRLGKDLNTLIRYQELFRRMWDEDKEIRQEQVDELRRKNTLREQMRSRAAAQAKGSGGSDTSISPTPRPPGPRFGPGVEAALENAPPPGPERDEWVRRVAEMAQRLRHAQEQQD
ncbi:hypothetical protein F4776DRAFT_619191 [Hypoxylon sp. NC0597]|nr:hypothetical protein F4776DRAFT_619191 [Hypoxylon sp. NC0597]